jgi:hypothetical protein
MGPGGRERNPDTSGPTPFQANSRRDLQLSARPTSAAPLEGVAEHVAHGDRTRTVLPTRATGWFDETGRDEPARSQHTFESTGPSAEQVREQAQDSRDAQAAQD